jgi:hypothetical protein
MISFVRLIASVILIFTTLNGLSQQGGNWQGGEKPKIGTIKGFIYDRVTRKPIEYANIAVLKKQDSSLVTGTISSPDGKFLMEQFEPGMYFIKISFIGYRDTVFQNIRITPKEPIINLDTIFLLQSDVTLQGTDIVAERSVLEYNLDKQVFNVDKDLTSTGGTALDVMKNIPSVTVDVDGNVSLRGSGNVNVLIDGKPSSLSAAQVLEQIPASMIERVEIITNPSAKYDPDGMSGIINVVTKKSKTPGYNGTLNLTVGNRNKYTGTITLGYKKNKVNFFGSYDFRYNERFHASWVNRDFGTDTVTQLDQDNYRINYAVNQSVKLGMDYSFNDYNTITLSGTLRTGNGTREDEIQYVTSDENNMISDYYERNNIQDWTEFNFDASLYYRKTFKQKGRELIFDSNFSQRDNDEDLTGTQFYSFTNYQNDNSESKQRNITGNNSVVFSMQLDYVHPTEKYGRFETGLKSIMRDYRNDLLLQNYDYTTTSWVDDTLISNSFQYQDQLYSAYLIYANAIGKLMVQGGLRAEQTYTHSYQVTLDSTFDYNYFNLFPSVHTKLPLKNQTELMMSYSRRINRPGTWSLNPFPDYSDPLNLRMGNPYLLPEFINSYEAGFMKYFKKWSIATTLFHRTTQNVIVRFRTVDEFGVSTMTQMNLTESNSTGTDLVFTINPKQNLRIMLSGSAYYFLQEGREEFNLNKVENFQWNAKINSSYTIKKGFDVQLSGYYNAPMITSQGNMREMFSMDFATKIDILKGNGNLTFRVSDIFNTQRHAMTSEGPGFYIDSYFKRESRVAYLGFSYKINGGTTRKEKRPDMNQGGGEFEMN